MSRHVFDTDGIRVVVGWDPPLNTFFIQRGVLDPETKNWIDDSEPNLWLGTKRAEIRTIQDLAEIDWGYQIGLSPETFRDLAADQEADV